jgi:4-diphosphocytidyl-2-C-methyl-D-erythritol kinase
VRLVALAPGKVNLCLLVGPRRDDGRHEVVTLIESVSLADELVLTDGDRDEVLCPGVDGPNLVARALEGLRARGWGGPPVRIEIEKQIPVAGGMGGGSADAAAALRLARSLAPIPDEALAEWAAELGSDVPSQLEPGLTLGTGAGDRIARREPLREHALVIVPLEHRLSAADVYAEADRLGLARSAEELSELLASELPFVNDLEPAAISLCPAVTDALAAVRATGADLAFVTGSGPTVCGLFWGQDAPDRAEAAARHLPAAKCAVPVQADFGYPRNPAQSGRQ